MEENFVDDLLAAPRDFLGVPPEFSNWERSRVALLPVPYDLTASYHAGARRGPQAVIDASHHCELYDEELQEEPYRVGIHTLTPVEVHAGGPDKMGTRVEVAVSDVLEAGKFPVVLGGDHSITVGAVRAFRERCPDLAVVQFDAHADLRHEYQGTKWSHACVGRRVVEMGISLTQIGVRTLSREEVEFLASTEVVTTVYARDVLADHRAAEHAIEELGVHRSVYITFDIDVLDPGIMPATGTPEPGGLDWYTTLAFLRRAFERHKVVGCDVVELAPISGFVAPDFLVAKLVYKLIGYRFRPELQR